MLHQTELSVCMFVISDSYLAVTFCITFALPVLVILLPKFIKAHGRWLNPEAGGTFVSFFFVTLQSTYLHLPSLSESHSQHMLPADIHAMW